MSGFKSSNLGDYTSANLTLGESMRNEAGCLSQKIRYLSGKLILQVYVNDLEVISSSGLTLLKFGVPRTIASFYDDLDAAFGVTARTVVGGRICATTTNSSLIPKNIDQSKFLLLEIHIHGVYHTESGTILVNVLHAHGSSKK